MTRQQSERDYYTQIHENAQARIKHMLTTIGELEGQRASLEEHRLLRASGEYRDALFVVSIDLMRVKESLTYLIRLEHQISNRMIIKPTGDEQ